MSGPATVAEGSRHRNIAFALVGKDNAVKTKSTKVFKGSDMFRQTFSRFRPASIVAVASFLLMLSGSASAQIIGNSFGLDTPLVYVEAGLVVDPLPGDYTFPAVPGAFIQTPPPPPPAPLAWYYWDPNQVPDPAPATPPPPPPTFTNFGPGIGVRFRGATAHTYAPHPDEVVPSTKWSYDISVAEPAVNGGWGPTGWWWAGETRIRASVAHPEGDHSDNYMAVVGVLRGSVPGPSQASRRVMIGGTLGVHFGTPKKPSPDPDPIYGGGRLEPKSHTLGPGGDYPMGELLTMVNTEDPANPRLSMMAIVDGLQGNMISNAFLRQGQNGPILMNLGPMMQMQHLGEYDSLLTISDASLPQSILPIMAAGNAYVSIGFPTSIHPDGGIVGAVSLVSAPSGAGDYNGDGVVDDLDYAAWRGAFGSTHSAADGNGNGIADAADYVTWRAHCGQSASLVSVGANSSSIPEPSLAAIAMLGLCLTTAGYRARSAAMPRVNELAGNTLRPAAVRVLAGSPLLTQRR